MAAMEETTEKQAGLVPNRDVILSRLNDNVLLLHKWGRQRRLGKWTRLRVYCLRSAIYGDSKILEFMVKVEELEKLAKRLDRIEEKIEHEFKPNQKTSSIH